MAPLEDILNEIGKQKNMTAGEINERIVKKQQELSGLVSLEGAAHLVARELGVEIASEAMRKLEIKNIVSGMKNINVVGKIFKISGINEFKRIDGSQGRVINLFIGDASGSARLPLWNDQVKLVEDKLLKLGDVVQISNGFAKENIFGDVEISLGKYGSIRQIEDSGLPSIEYLSKPTASQPQRDLIQDIKQGNSEILATMVNVFKGNFIFDVCPICGSSVNEKKCLEHGEVEPRPALVISCIVDDGSGNMRSVFFRSLAERLLGADAMQIASLDVDKRYHFITEKLIGRELILIGKVKKSNIFDRLELMVNDFKDLSVSEESKRLVDEIGLKLGEFTTEVSQ